MLSHSFYKKTIESKLEHINQLVDAKKSETFTEYKTDFASCYGGWNMYRIVKKTGGTFGGRLGFFSRKNSSEMIAYLEGLQAGLQYPFHCK